MSTRTVILSAAASNLVVVAAAYAVHGWNAAGAHAAARNSARLSALWFALAFAAPGLVRFFRSLPAPYDSRLRILRGPSCPLFDGRFSSCEI